MLGVTTTGSHSHVRSQALDEVRHRLINVFLWQLIPDGLQAISVSKQTRLMLT